VPGQTELPPVIADGSGNTVTTDVVIQPVTGVYVIVLVPTATPFTTPDDTFTVAVEVALLLQVPPVIALVNVVDAPAQTESVPVIEEGSVFTETLFVT
jgi:hypothetical protein